MTHVSDDYIIPHELRDDIKDICLELSDMGLEVGHLFIPPNLHLNYNRWNIETLYRSISDKEKKEIKKRTYPAVFIYKINGEDLNGNEMIEVKYCMDRLSIVLEPHNFVISELYRDINKHYFFEIIKII